MKIDVLTLFPGMFAGPLDESIIKRARQAGLLDLQLHQLRDWAHDRHKTVDDRPFGGGPGMLLKPEPIFEAVDSLKREKTRVVLIERVYRHPRYERVVRRSKRLKAHDEANSTKVGDRVLIEETRPLSHDKRWRIRQVIERTA